MEQQWTTVAAFRHEDGIDFSILLERKVDFSYFRIRTTGADDPKSDGEEYLIEELLGTMSLSCALRKLGKAVAMLCDDSDLMTLAQIRSSIRNG